MKTSTLLASLVILSLLSGACASDNEQNSGAQMAEEPLERIDPQSAPLYPAKQLAKANDFEMPLVTGESFRLSEHTGKVIIINLWATWCPPCHDETPDFVELYNQYKEDGLLILGVSIDEQGRSVVEPFMEKYEVNYPMIIDDGTVMDKYGPTMGMPTSYIIDKEGNLRYFAVGALTNKELEPKIQRLLSE